MLSDLAEGSEASGYPAIIATRVILTIEDRGDNLHLQDDEASQAKLMAFFDACTATLDHHGVTQDALSIISDRFCLHFRNPLMNLVP